MKKRKKKNSKNSKKRSLIILLQIGLVIACVRLATELGGMERENTQCDTTTEQEYVSPGRYGDLLDVKTNPALPAVKKKYKGMDVSFNPKTHIPNWVAWELTAKETQGKEPRTNKFSNDESVEGCADTWDYSYSGYDRGHMAPAGDMKWDRKAMEETFFLTNICPQVKALNVGAWRTLEEKCRQWAQQEGRIYIVCGPVIGKKPMEYIGDSRVWVPDSFFKVIIAPYANPPRGIGFLMPNSDVKGGMQSCVVSIDSVETVTGHDFFHALPDNLEEQLESQHKFSQWTYSRKKKKDKE